MRRFFCAIFTMVFLMMPVRGLEQTKYVALTFDDGPSGRFTQRLLEGLAQRDVQATFFLCGYRLADYGNLARRIYESGHEIGIHGYSHKDMSKMTQGQIEQELRGTMKLLPEGCRPVFMRPPGGAVGPAVLRAAKNVHLAVLNWSVDPQDWRNLDAATVEASVVEAVRDGDVILLHDMYDGSVDGALAIIDNLRARGFQFVTVSRLAALRGTIPQPGCVYRHF